MQRIHICRKLTITENTLLLNISKTKELIADFKKKGGKDTPLSIPVELRWSFKLLGISITKKLVILHLHPGKESSEMTAFLQET